MQVFTLKRSQSPCNHALALVSMTRRSLCALSVSPLSCVVNLTPTLLWSPSETFSFVLTGEDGSRWFGYCRKLLVSISVRAGGTESTVWALSGHDSGLLSLRGHPSCAAVVVPALGMQREGSRWCPEIAKWALGMNQLLELGVPQKPL